MGTKNNRMAASILSTADHVKYRETSCSPPRPAKNYSTVSLLSTFVCTDRNACEKRWIISGISECVKAHFRNEKSVSGCHWKRLKIMYRSSLLKTSMLE